MEAIIFTGIQGSGKSTFYKEYFFNTHIRISLDLLNTRNKQNLFLETCFATHSKFVVDNTSPTIEDRKLFIDQARARKYKIIGYYFKSTLDDALERNNQRTGKQRIPEVGVKACYKKIVLPTYQEGFDELYSVEIKDNKFIISNWQNEV
ncbi:ATP-binding protein [Chondrinema litorale]|uniref:ATP-binding protein n=1 Tax=Chondrinema litorale TaxID=2994555 RepID=UPI0025428E90|nr:ATP-binding protein [Chondrinema litorale]UZR95275.1 ATP-binding protein [Chondrinema litorale]